MHPRVFATIYTYAHCKSNYWEKKLEECNEIPSHTYIEKQCGQIFSLFVYFLIKKHNVHAINMCPNK